jgi:hypothetical protein
VSRDLGGVSCDVSSVAVYWEPTAHRVLASCVDKTKGSIVCIRGKKDILCGTQVNIFSESLTNVI